MAVVNWRMLEALMVRWAAHRAEPNAGNRIATSRAMIAMTTKSSMSVKARCILDIMGTGSSRSCAAPTPPRANTWSRLALFV